MTLETSTIMSGSYYVLVVQTCEEYEKCLCKWRIIFNFAKNQHIFCSDKEFSCHRPRRHQRPSHPRLFRGRETFHA